MAIEKVQYYKADDGKTYSSYSQAQTAQKAWRLKQVEEQAAQEQRGRLYKIFQGIHANDTANSLYVQAVVGKADTAIQLRDALNKVVDFHRRREARKAKE